MKSRFTITQLILIILLSNISQAQICEKGLYLTPEDFSKEKLAYASKHTHLKLHEFFKNEIVEIKYNDSSFTFLKKNVFGYRDADCKHYRFFNDKIYPIVNPTEMLLIYKVSEGPALKGQEELFKYFFSKNSSLDILPLTIKNLEIVFKENEVFQEYLEVHFKSDNELLEYDNAHGVYKINRLLQLSQTHKQ